MMLYVLLPRLKRKAAEVWLGYVRNENEGFGKSTKWVSFFSKDRTVILESPALPVSQGATVTLRCKAEMKSSDHRFNFYKDGRSIGSSSTGEMTIHSASKSDEGLYKCSISGGVESVGSWLAVEGEINSLHLTYKYVVAVFGNIWG